MSRCGRTLVFLCLILPWVAGCQVPQQRQQIEVELSEARSSLEQAQETLAQCGAREERQSEMLKAAQERIIGLENRNRDLEASIVELRRQKEVAESELAKQKAELKKQSATLETFKQQNQTLTEQLDESRSVIKSLQAKIKEISKQPATQSNQAGAVEK